MTWNRAKAVVGLLLIVASISATQEAGGGGAGRLLRGQTLYVPVYSHIFAGDRESPFYLAATLSVRNTDSRNPINLLGADYYDSDGKLLNRVLDSPVLLKPLASWQYVIAESDRRGGPGASFLVKWKAERPVSPPLVETVMISTRSQQGVSFTSRGQVVEEVGE